MSEDAVLTPEALRAWRASVGLSQVAVAELLGVRVMTISDWETGKYRIPLSVTYAVKWLSERER